MNKTVNVADIVTVADISSMSGFSVARVNGIVARVTPLRPVAKGQTGIYDVQEVRAILRKDFAQLLDFINSGADVPSEQSDDAQTLDA
ncbi:MAG TPA: hypothetical protein VIY48_19115 [Candidatus Paceibacterota bacterium]